MPHTVTVQLAAQGQGLAVVQAPAVLASGVIDFLRLELATSSEWEGLELTALVRNGGEVTACPVVGGVAVVDGAAVARPGVVEVAIMGQGSGARYTSTVALLELRRGV